MAANAAMDLAGHNRDRVNGSVQSQLSRHLIRRALNGTSRIASRFLCRDAKTAPSPLGNLSSS